MGNTKKETKLYTSSLDKHAKFHVEIKDPKSVLLLKRNSKASLWRTFDLN